MRNNFIIFITIIGLVFLFSCKKDETKAILKNSATAPILTSPSAGTTKVFTIADSAKNIDFTWDKADFGYAATITYALQIDKANNQFKKPANIATTTVNNTASVNIYALVNTLLAMGLVENQSSAIEVRVRAIITAINSSTFADTSISSSITMNVTPFPVIINYPKLYVPGSYEGWNEKTAPTISSVNSDDSYEGYLYFTEAVTTLKMLRNPVWEQDNAIGDPNASGTSGTLQIGNWGGNNISIPGGPGYFKFNANLSAKTYSYLKTTWGLIGDGTPGGWDTDTPMTYDMANNVLKVTVNLTVGSIKFRANNAWDLNYGDNLGNGKLQVNGANIAVPSAGNYTVTLDLSKAIYKYILEKN